MGIQPTRSTPVARGLNDRSERWQVFIGLTSRLTLVLWFQDVIPFVLSERPTYPLRLHLPFDVGRIRLLTSNSDSKNAS